MNEQQKQALRKWKAYLGLDPDEEIHLTEEEEKQKQLFLEALIEDQRRRREAKLRREQEAQEQTPEHRE